jgi:hypothetical protein
MIPFLVTHGCDLECSDRALFPIATISPKITLRIRAVKESRSAIASATGNYRNGL